VGLVQLARERLELQSKTETKLIKTSSTEVPRHLWNKLSTVPTSLFSSLASIAQRIKIRNSRQKDH
jgi:hypothetical protein